MFRFYLEMLNPVNLVRFPGEFKQMCKGTGFGPAFTRMAAPFLFFAWALALITDIGIVVGLLYLLMNHVTIGIH